MLIVSISAILCSVIIIGILLYIYQLQWTWGGYNRFLWIDYSEDVAYEKIYEDSDMEVYTYQISACDIEMF